MVERLERVFVLCREGDVGERKNCGGWGLCIVWAGEGSGQVRYCKVLCIRF